MAGIDLPSGFFESPFRRGDAGATRHIHPIHKLGGAAGHEGRADNQYEDREGAGPHSLSAITRAAVELKSCARVSAPSCRQGDRGPNQDRVLSQICPRPQAPKVKALPLGSDASSWSQRQAKCSAGKFCPTVLMDPSLPSSL